MKKLLILPLLLFYGLLSAQYDKIDTTFNRTYQGTNKGLTGKYGAQYMYNYQDSLFLIAGSFSKYNNEVSQDFVLIDKKGNIVKTYPYPTDLNLDSIVSFPKNKIAFNGQFIYRIRYGALIKYDLNGKLVDTIYNQNNRLLGLSLEGENIYCWSNTSVAHLKNGTIFNNHFIDIPKKFQHNISDLHYTKKDSSFILSVRKGNPRDSIIVYKYNYDGSLNTDFISIAYDAVTSYEIYVTNNKIYTHQDLYKENYEYIKSSLIRYNLDGKVDTSFNSDGKHIWLLIKLAEDQLGNVIISGFFNNDSTQIKKFSKYGFEDSQFSPKINRIPNAIDFTILHNGKILMIGDFETFDGIDVGNIAMMQGQPKYECNNLALDIIALNPISCNKNGYTKFKVEGGISPFEYYLNDSLIASLDSISFAKKGFQTVRVNDASGCTQSIVFFMSGELHPLSYDLSAIYTSSPLVRGFEHNAWIDVTNVSCTTKDARLTFSLPTEIKMVSAFPAPLVVQGNVYIWNIDQLNGNKRIQLVLKTSTASQLGELKKFKVKVTPIEEDTDDKNNASELTLAVQGSYDPNDITSSPSKCSAHYIQKDQKIKYTVRFQNIGNFPAQDVFILDSLDPHLDLTTLEVLASSHTMHVEKIRNQVLKFKFDNIDLPGKSMDDIGSQGYFVFEIALLPSTPLNTVIDNKVEIYFDFNDAVITNNVFNTVMDKIQTYASIEEIVLCHGGSFVIDDIKIKKDTTFQLLKYAINGCDSLANYIVKVKSAINNELKIDNQTLVASSGYSSYQWYNCKNNELVYSSTTSNEYSPNESGSYAAIIYDGNCIAKSACVDFVIEQMHDYVPFVAANKHWFYIANDGSDVNPGNLHAFVLSTGIDTVINASSYTKLLSGNLKGSHPCQFPPCFTPAIPYEIGQQYTVAYLREDLISRKVFLLPAFADASFCASDEYEIYNFNLKKHDSLSICLLDIISPVNWNNNSALGIVKSKENVQSYNKERAIWNFDGVYQSGLPFVLNMNLIEGVGLNLYNGFYKSTNTFLFNFCEGSMSECNLVSNNVETSLDKIKIYPNPFSSHFTIDTDSDVSEVKVINALGQLIYSGKSTKEIDLSALADGIYILEVKIGETKQNQCLMKRN